MTDAPPPLPVMPLDYAEPPPATASRLVRAVGWVNVVVGTAALFGIFLTPLFGFRGRGFSYYVTPIGLLGDLLVSVAQLTSGILCTCRSRAAGRFTAVWLWTVSAVAALNVAISVADYSRYADLRTVFVAVVAASRYARPIGNAILSYLVTRRFASRT